MVGDISQAFSKDRDETENDRMRRLMQTAERNSPIAAEVLKEAFSKGCGFRFQVMDGCAGAYDPAGMVYLNPVKTDAELLTTLVHECRHASQPQIYVVLANNMRTNLQMCRAKEADACAYECASAFEMKDAVPEVWQKFKHKHHAVAESYSNEINDSNDNHKALSEAFKVFHDDMRYLNKYDSDTLDLLYAHSSRAGRLFLTRDIPPEEIADKVCQYKGERYLKETSFMSSARALTVDEKQTWPKTQLIYYRAYDAYDYKDSSLEELYTKTPTGEVKSQRKEPKPTETQKSINEEKGNSLNVTPVKGVPPELWSRVVTLKGGQKR